MITASVSFQCAVVDLETLFCNIDQIIELSQCLLTSLEGATCGRSFDEQIIGMPWCTYVYVADLIC